MLPTAVWTYRVLKIVSVNREGLQVPEEKCKLPRALSLFLPCPIPSHIGWRLKFSSSLKSDYIRKKVPFQNRYVSCMYSESHLFVSVTLFLIYYLHLLYACSQKRCEGENKNPLLARYEPWSCCDGAALPGAHRQQDFCIVSSWEHSSHALRLFPLCKTPA